MVTAISAGRLVAVHEPVYSAPTSVRLTDDYTADYAAIYASQPAVRTVVDFLARNVSQLALQTFERISDKDRKRLTDHPVARVLSKPNRYTTGVRLVRDMVADRGIYDRALWAISAFGAKPELVRVPPEVWKVANKGSWLAPEEFTVQGSNGEYALPADACVYFRGYNPRDPRQGLSPIESLRRVLAEEFAAGQLREQQLRNGARLSGYITRPKEAGDWSDVARGRFSSGWRSQYQGQSATDGAGTPVLEDGMTFTPASQSSVDLQYVEARKLTREEVASAYHIPPPMVGILDHATFGNITEQHKMLYQDTLGPILAEVHAELALQLIPHFDTTGAVYVEFNMMEKLRGSFEEQAQQLQTSVGAPFLTRNEARARANLPAVAGGDELVVPLNVLVGGQASPTDSAPKALGALRSVTVTPAPSLVAKAREVLDGFFLRQSAAVLSKIGAGADWWDGDRWDRELRGDLLALSKLISDVATENVVDQLGGGTLPDEDMHALSAFASGAEHVNRSTREALLAASGGDGFEEKAREVFADARTVRAADAAVTLSKTFAGFGAVRAAVHASTGRTSSKTWHSGCSDATHAALDGETVAVGAKFSNGLGWPECRCGLSIHLEGGGE